MLLSQEDEVGQRKKTDEPTADDDVDEQEDEEQQEQDTEQTSSEPDVQQTNQSSPRKRTKADLEVSTSMIQYDTIEEFNVDSKAEYSALSSTRSQKKKLKQTTPVPLWYSTG